MKPPFPEVIDSTMLESFQTCPQKFYWEWLHRIRPVGQNIHLVAGGAFAAGLEHARKAFHVEGLSPERSVQIGLQELLKKYTIDVVTDKKPIDLVAQAFLGYFDRWPLDTDYIQPAVYGGKPCIEFSFALPLPVAHPTTGNPILICGRADLIGVRGGAQFVVDEKTQSQLGQTWSSKWTLRAQFTCYAWAAREHGYNVLGSITRGIRLTQNLDFAEAITYQPEWKVARWYEQTLRRINRMIEMWQAMSEEEPHTAWDLALGDPCSSYGGCPFQEHLCNSERPLLWIEGNFVPNTWNPLTRED